MRRALPSALARLRGALLDVLVLALETDERLEALKCDGFRRIPL